MTIISDSKNKTTLPPAISAEEFEELYEQYFNKIYNHIYFRVHNSHTADDLTSQVFIKVLEKFHTYDSTKSQLSTWLYTIANNIIVDHFRKNKKVIITTIDNTCFSLKDPSIDIQKDVLNNENNQYLLNALSELSDVQKNLISLKFWGGFNNREIAKLTDLSESNVGVILHRSLKILKKKLPSLMIE